MKASIIIPTYNRAWILKHCLNYLLNQSVSDYEIIVIDDKSKDSTADLISRLSVPDTKLKYIKLDKHSGPHTARNIGIRAAKGELVIFVDSDVLVHLNFIKDHIAIHEKHPRIILQGMVRYVTDIKKVNFKHFYTNLMSFGILVSQNASVKKEHLIKSGLFDETFGVGYEDIDLGIRLQNLGLTFRYAIKQCMAYHINPPYNKKSINRYISKHFERGKCAYYFVKKHGTKGEQIAHTQQILTIAKLFNTDKWVEKPSCITFLEHSIDSPIYPLFPLFRKLLRYHYRAKGIKEAKLNQKG